MAEQLQDQSVEHLLGAIIRKAIEQSVSDHLGRTWRIDPKGVRDMIDFASHPAAILSDNSYSVFVKLYKGNLAHDQFTRELAGLRLLTERSGVRTPVVIAHLQVKGGSLGVMEAVQMVERQPLHWRQMGEALARVHSAKWDRYGFDTYCYWGSLYVDNTPSNDWPEFFWAHRIAPRLKAAVDSGNLPLALGVAQQVDSLEPRIQDLCGQKLEPTLLHGDAQQNNILSTADGPILIDSAIYYGHPEVDLAFVDFFAPVSDELFRGYEAVTPIDPGFYQRRDFWRLPALLAMVELDGPRNVPRLVEALRRYI